MSDPTQTQDDEFSAAFAELQTPATSSTPTAAAAPAAPAEAAVSPSASVAASADTPAAAAAVPPGEAGNPSAGAAAATPAGTAEASTSIAAQPAATPQSEAQPDLAAQFAALQAELAELKRNPPAAAQAPTPTPAAATPTPSAPASPFTPEEQAVVDTYVKEWPDMARGERLLRRAEYGQLVQHIFEQLRPRLEALESGYETSSSRTQYQDLVALVPDYDDVRDKTLAWIDTQPGYLKNAYQNVANTGSAKDVADLITRFKKETGYVAPAGVAPANAPAVAPAAAAAPAAPVATAGLAPAAAAAAASLKIVKSSRSEPVSNPDPNDFDAAFKEAVGG